MIPKKEKTRKHFCRGFMVLFPVDGGLFLFFFFDFFDFFVVFVVFVFFVIHGFEALLHDLGEGFHLVLIRGEEFFIFAVDDDLHDIDFRAMLVIFFFFVFTSFVSTAAAAVAAAFGIDEYRVLLSLVIKIVYDLKFKFIALVIGENH